LLNGALGQFRLSKGGIANIIQLCRAQTYIPSSMLSLLLPKEKVIFGQLHTPSLKLSRTLSAGQNSLTLLTHRSTVRYALRHR